MSITASRSSSRHRMRSLTAISVVCRVALLVVSLPAAAGAQGKLELVEFASRIFENTRLLRVWLPPGYDAPANRDRIYPVLYLNDGQNLFDSATSMNSSEEWRVDETAARLIESGDIVPLVVVGIDNAGRRDRAREYLPYPDEFLEPPEPHPQGTRYGDFLGEEVLPFIQGRYRVAETRAGRTLGGSSYGALVALHVALKKPELFSGLLLESGSFYVDDNHVLRQARATERIEVSRVYLGVGTNELAVPGCGEHADNRLAVDGVKALAGILRDVGLRDAETLKVLIEPCAVHSELAWASRLPSALRFLFGR